MNWEDKIGGMLFDYEEDTISQEEIIDAIKSLLKKQRENCANELSPNIISFDVIKTNILNAPEPKGMPDKVREWDFTKSAPDE